MREMKDSRIKWIGEIPKNWDVSRAKNSFVQKSERGNTESLVLLSPTQNYGVIPQDVYEQLSGFRAVKLNIATDLSTLKTVHKGAFVISLRSFQGGFEYSEYEGVVSPAYQVFYPNTPVCDHYFKYLFKSQAFIDKMNSFTLSLRDGKNIAFADFARTYIPIPPLEEQHRIAAILNQKCEQVNDLIANVQAQIEKLKAYKQSVITEVVTKGLNPTVPMKDSGVEWIGEIPEHWGLWRVSDIGEFKKGPFGSAVKKEMFVEQGPNTYKVYEQKNAIYKDASLGYYYLPQEDYERLISFAVQPGDMIVSCAGTIGESYIMPENCEEGIINQALMRVRLNGKVNHAFFVYVFSCIMDLETPKYSNGSAMKNIPPFNYLLKFLLPCPPISEQGVIVSELARRCEKVDQLIAIKQKKIDKLNEYKKSLIYEYVTGKREV